MSFEPDVPRVSAMPEHFRAALALTAPERGPFGQQLSYFDEVPSTNDLAAAAAEQGAIEGTTFVAGSQTAGRGRLGRTWYSPPGAGLYVSTIIRRPLLFPWVTLAAGVAAAEGITRASGLPVQIKWPNDIFSVAGPQRRKIAGILAEASTTGSHAQHVVLGIGINVAAVVVPHELSGVATSIESELGRPIDAGAVLAQTLACLNDAFEQIVAAGPPALLARWTAVAPLAHGARIEWDGGNGVVTGVTAGIDADGALLARVGDETRRIMSGAVRWE